MKKTPTVFERDWNGDRSRVLNKINPGCEWVINGEGVATRKLDGTCCMVRDGKLFKRREIKAGQKTPANFELADNDSETGKIVGWVPVEDIADDKYHNEAFLDGLPDGTYELLGPKIQGNIENYPEHVLIAHSNPNLIINDVPRNFDDLREWLSTQNMEGLVFHHENGKMAKIKLRDFGLNRSKGDKK